MRCIWRRRAAARGIDLAGIERGAAPRRAASPGAARRSCAARLEAAWGARVTEAMGIGDIAVSLWGECEAQAGMHFSGRGFVHVELIDPETGAPRAFEDGRGGGARLYPPAPPRGAAAALPQPRPRAGAGGRLRLRAHRAAGALHRAHRRHADRARGQPLPDARCARWWRSFAPAVSGVIAIRPRRRGRQAGAAAAGGGRAGRGAGGGRRARRGDRAAGARAAGRGRRGRAACPGGACRAATTSRSSSTGPRAAD